MPRSMKLLVLAVLSTLLIITACDNSGTSQSQAQQWGHDHAHDHAHDDAHVKAWTSVTKAIAVLTPTEGNSARGVITFEKVDGGVRVYGEVSGLNPNQQHAMHVHEWGDISSADGTAAGSHYNPEGHDHGLPNGGDRHAGDFGNLQADENGVAKFDQTFDNISVADMKNPVIGRALIVHAQPDDGSQPVGNAGPRIAQAVIGIAKPN